MRKLIFISVVLAIIGFSTSCVHPTDFSNTPTISFDTLVKPIFLGSCAMSGCHDSTGSGEGRPLTTYSQVMSHNQINPGDPKGSKIYQKVTVGTGEDFMPRYPVPALSDRQLKLLYLWIGQGAKDN